jgi:hypothetical protein
MADNIMEKEGVVISLYHDFENNWISYKVSYIFFMIHVSLGPFIEKTLMETL